MTRALLPVSERQRTRKGGQCGRAALCPKERGCYTDTMAKRAASKHPTEFQEQCAVIQWCRRQHPSVLIGATPNGIWTPSAAARGRAKAEGVITGYPDLKIEEARGHYHGLRIEMKRRRKSLSRTSDEQLQCIHALMLRGFYATVCYGFDEARETIDWYLALGPFKQADT